MKKAILIIIALLTVLVAGSVYASEVEEVIYEKETAVISIEESNTRYTKVSNVVIDGKLYMKVYKMYIYDKFEEHFVRYTDETGIIRKVVRWLVKSNGKVSFPSGEKPVKIVTEK